MLKNFYRPSRSLVAQVSPTMQLERGNSATISKCEKIALIAQFSPHAIQKRSLSAYTQALEKSGFLPIVISTSPAAEKLEFPFGLADSTLIYRRKNIGYDFGSWAQALKELPGVQKTRVTLLTNDSLLGPFADISPLLDWICQEGADIRALTTSWQFTKHLQSYFLAFRGGILQDQVWQDFFSSIRTEPEKMDVVTHYEIGLSRIAYRYGYSGESYIYMTKEYRHFNNPTVTNWKEILESGVPFVKRTLFTEADSVNTTTISEYLEQKYNVNLNEW